MKLKRNILIDIGLISLLVTVSGYAAYLLFWQPLLPMMVFGNGVKVNFITPSGKIKLETDFDDYDRGGWWSEGMFIVKHDGKSGFIDRRGNIIGPVFDEVKPFSEGLAAVKYRGKWGFVDKKGKPLWFDYDAAGSFCEGLAPVQVAGKYGYINKEGQMVIQPLYDLALPFAHGMAAVMTGAVKVDMQLTPDIRCIMYRAESLLAMINTKKWHGLPLGRTTEDGFYRPGIWGYIGKKGDYLIEPQFNFANSFSKNGLAAVSQGARFGYINRRGNFTVFPAYGFAMPMNGDRGIVLTGEGDKAKTGVVDMNGNVIVKPAFESIMPFSRGLAAVKTDGKWGYIDENGKSVIPPQFTKAGQFLGGYAKVSDLSGKSGYIDTNGRFILTF